MLKEKLPVEITEESIATFCEAVKTSARDNIGQTIEDLCSIFTEINNTTKDIDTQIKELQTQKKNNEAISSLIKQNIEELLEGEEFLSSAHKVSYRKSSTVEIEDWTQIPEQYFKERSEKDIMLSKVKTVLTQGFVVAGARLQTHNNMMISTVEKNSTVDNTVSE